MASLFIRRPAWSLAQTVSVRSSVAFPTSTSSARVGCLLNHSSLPSSLSLGILSSTPIRALSTSNSYRAAASPSPAPSKHSNSTPKPKEPPLETARSSSLPANPSSPSTNPSPSTPISNLRSGFSDEPPSQLSDESTDWTRSFKGLSTEAFSKEAADILTAELSSEDVEVKPDGILYLPEIKYRRILNKAFGPGAWGLAPRGESIVTAKSVTREYALVVHGRLVSIARGEMDYFSPEMIPTAAEGCKSNAMMRCCKDLGVASELWDPRWIREFKSKHTKEVWVEHIITKRKSKAWVRKDDEVRYPWKESK